MPTVKQVVHKVEFLCLSLQRAQLFAFPLRLVNLHQYKIVVRI